MRTESLDKVQLAMKDKTEYTAREIEQRTGLSYNTVLTALGILGAEQVPDTKPRKWKMATGVVTIKTETGVFIDTLASKWASGRDRISNGIGSIEVLPDSDPKDLARYFEDAARTMNNAAYTLREVANKPDWFELIGGNLEDYQVN